jgi:hypothetical protein
MKMMSGLAEPLCVMQVNLELAMYAKVPRHADTLVPRIFVVVTTGDRFNDEGKTYIGSTLLGDPPWFVAHVFEQEHGYEDPIDPRSEEDFAQIHRELASNDNS